MHDDESLQGTITREMQEECGIRAEDILHIQGPLYDFEWMKGEIKIREFVYAVLVKDNLAVTLSAEEHDDYRWCDETALFETLEKEQNIIAGKKVLAQLHA
jgi:8-oxo-dGTP pyrophosphatase MutT (NUDIX family)